MEWISYSAKFSFEPVIGEIYHLYRDAEGINFLSLIGPNEWNKGILGLLNSIAKKWTLLNAEWFIYIKITNVITVKCNNPKRRKHNK
jgi:hypothetical protein